MVDKDGNVVPLMTIVAHTSDSNISEENEASFEESDPQRLNKLASNIALGRDMSGAHWRSDGIEGLESGEAVALGILRDVRATYHEDFQSFSLATCDGTTRTI